MALITIHAVVDVSGHVGVLEIGRIVPAVASRALKDCVIIRVGMTRGADAIGVAVRDREGRVLRVIEGGARPGGCVVAVLARVGEELRLGRVARIGGVVVVSLMASDAGGRKGGVVVVDVAFGTLPWRNRMGSRQRESGVVVIESRVGPDGRVVTQLAGSWESRSRVRRIRRARVVRLVARIAERAVERIVVVLVAVGAGSRRNHVCPRQLEARAGVIKRSIAPPYGVVAGLAGGRECSRRVVHRRDRIGVVGLMAAHAGRARQVVVIVGVAIAALPRRNCVRARQRKSGAAVVERRIQPGRRVMALVASLREIRGHVIGVGRSLVIGQVARHARVRADVVVAVFLVMAIRTLPRWHCVHSGQRKACSVVVEARVGPGCRVMALLTGLRDACGRVVGLGRPLIVLHVAAHAGRAAQVVIVIDVAIGAQAGRNSVSAGQRKPSRGVIKFAAHPVVGSVAVGAGRRESSRNVAWVGGRFEIRRVTRVALG